MEEVKKMNLSLNLTNISSVTAYGPDFAKNGEGVLLLNTRANLRSDLDTLVGMAALSKNEKKDFEMLQQKPFALYTFKEQIYLLPFTSNAVLVAKSRDQLENAREVVLGKADSLAKGSRFKNYPKIEEPLTFLAMAEGFNDFADIPPQAQVLREAKGGRLAFGEKDKEIFANLVFQVKDEEASTKIQQVLQGIVALISLSQPDKEITQLASNSKIAADGATVSVDLHYGVAKLIERIEEKHQPVKNKPQRKRSKRAKAETEHTSEKPKPDEQEKN
jgi:hypothetical protein